MLKTKLLCFIAIYFIIFSGVRADYSNYKYIREIMQVDTGWNRIIIPNELFSKVQSDFDDFRIIGIDNKKDTIEIPYIFQINKDKVNERKINFKLINVSNNKEGYYYTFELDSIELINKIELNFDLENYDWKIKLEGSNNQKEWFTVIDNYRILSIKNSNTDFKYNSININESKYKYFRLLVKTSDKHELISTQIKKDFKENGEFRVYDITKQNIYTDRKSKQTIIDVSLSEKVPINQISISSHSDFDYYRQVSIKYLKDSVKTEMGYYLDYVHLSSGILSSIYPNVINLNNEIVDNIQLVIDNEDNLPIEIDSIKITGNMHSIIFKYIDGMTYHLLYGNSRANAPRYDMYLFSDKIPKSINTSELSIGKRFAGYEKDSTTPLLENKSWLIAILMIIASFLGWFAIKMLKQKS